MKEEITEQEKRMLDIFREAVSQGKAALKKEKEDDLWESAYRLPVGWTGRIKVKAIRGLLEYTGYLISKEMCTIEDDTVLYRVFFPSGSETLTFREKDKVLIRKYTQDNPPNTGSLVKAWNNDSYDFVYGVFKYVTSYKHSGTEFVLSSNGIKSFDNIEVIYEI